MKIIGESITVFHKKTKLKRVFSLVQWNELGASGQADWTAKRPAEAGEDEDQAGTDTAPAETTEQMIARLVKEGVAAALAGQKVLTPTPTAMEMTGTAVPQTDANTPVPEINGEGTNVKLTDGQTPEEVQAALRKSAEDDKNTAPDDSAKDDNPELTAARKRYEELYPGQEAGRKQLKTLQEAIALKESEGK